MDEYKLRRKVSKSRRKTRAGVTEYYQFIIPKIWAEKVGLDKNPEVEVLFNGVLKIIPSKKSPSF